MPIRQYTALFSLLGVTYGGDGRTTFGLPDLRGRAAVAPGQRPGGSNYALGEMAGAETVAVGVGMLGAHSHPLNAAAATATTDQAAGNCLAAQPTGRGGVGGHLYAPAPGDSTLGSAVQPAGGSGQAHTNVQPYLALRYVIALQGIFPQRP